MSVTDLGTTQHFCLQYCREFLTTSCFGIFPEGVDIEAMRAFGLHVTKYD